jgi:type II secretory pathway pseudopilin PulG
MHRLKSPQGLSLVEVTIMLLVLMLLTGVLAPSVMDFVNDARWVKVKEDCEAIGLTVARLTRDVGPCLKFNGSGPCDKANRVDILASNGPDVQAADLQGAASTDFSSSAITPGSINWDNDSDALVGDRMENQFVTNAPGYATPQQNYPASSPVGPAFGLGWRGGYLPSPIGPDPWGKRYLVNTAFLAMASDSSNGTEMPLARVVRDMPLPTSGRWWNRDVFCLSPGPNGFYETYFGGCTSGDGTCRGGDDFVYVISGSGR